MKNLMPLEKFTDKINDAIYEAEGKTISKSGCWASLDTDKNGSQYITVSCANGKDLEPVQKIVETLMKVFYRDKMDFIFDIVDSPVDHALYVTRLNYSYKDANIRYYYNTDMFMIEGFGESYTTLQEAQKGVDEWIERHGIDFTRPLPEDINDCGTKVKDSTEAYWQMVQKDYGLTDEDMSNLAKNYVELRKMIVEALMFARNNNLIAYAPAGSCDCLFEFKENVKDFAFETSKYIKK